MGFRSLNHSLATSFCQFSTATATTMSDNCFYFLLDLPRLFRYLRYLAIMVMANYSILKAFLRHITKIKQMWWFLNSWHQIGLKVSHKQEKQINFITKQTLSTSDIITGTFCSNFLAVMYQKTFNERDLPKKNILGFI